MIASEFRIAWLQSVKVVMVVMIRFVFYPSSSRDFESWPVLIKKQHGFEEEADRTANGRRKEGTEYGYLKGAQGAPSKM